MSYHTSAKSLPAFSRELEYQRHHAETQAAVQATPAMVMDRYASLRYAGIIQKDFMYRELGVGGAIEGKKLLDFGCGTGETSTQLAALGASVIGMDISPELIALSRRRAHLDGVADRIEFLTADLMQDPPATDTFDLILCSAVLHHVDFRVVLPVLRNCLKPGGKIVIGEPTAMSSLLARIRQWLPVPQDVSPDEKQFNSAEVAAIAGAFDHPHVEYFNLTSRLIRFLPMGFNLEAAPAVTRATVVLLMTIDRWLAKIPFLRRFFGAVTITGTKLA